MAVETFAMVAIALVALVAAFVTISAMAQRCTNPRATLLETLPVMTSNTGLSAVYETVVASDAFGSHALALPSLRASRLDVNQTLDIRGSVRAVSVAPVAAVFAKIDDGAAIRAVYGSSRADAFHVVVSTDGVPPGAHLVHVQVVTRDGRDVREPLPPLHVVLQ